MHGGTSRTTRNERLPGESRACGPIHEMTRYGGQATTLRDHATHDEAAP